MELLTANTATLVSKGINQYFDLCFYNQLIKSDFLTSRSGM